MERIFKEVREMKQGDVLIIDDHTQSEAMRRIRIFAEVAGWKVMGRTCKDDKTKCELTRVF